MIISRVVALFVGEAEFSFREFNEPVLSRQNMLKIGIGVGAWKIRVTSNYLVSVFKVYIP